MKNKSASERFWEKVNISSEDRCWNWSGNVNNTGYGTFYFQKKIQKSHRVSWILTYGEIPELPNSDYRGTCVLHKCDNRTCCNPKHLFLGTNDDNMKDMARKGRSKNHPKPGESHPNHKITEKQVIEIRSLYSSNRYNQYELAETYGISQTGIGKIILRKTWNHVQ